MLIKKTNKIQLYKKHNQLLLNLFMNFKNEGSGSQGI